MISEANGTSINLSVGTCIRGFSGYMTTREFRIGKKKLLKCDLDRTIRYLRFTMDSIVIFFTFHSVVRQNIYN